MTSNREKSKDFYQNSLELPLESEDQYGSEFKLFESSLRITETNDFTPSPHPVLGWEVLNLKDTILSLNAKQIAMQIYEGFGQDSLGIWHSPDGKKKLAWFNDPDGNVICLIENS